MPPHLRLYRIMRAFPGLSPAAIGEVPGVTWDWLLQIHDVHQEEAGRG